MSSYFKNFALSIKYKALSSSKEIIIFLFKILTTTKL